MTAIEQLLRNKLAARLDEEKRKIAETILIEEPADPAEKKAKKAAQIGRLQQQISLLQGKVSSAKDPAAAKDALDIKKEKLKLLQNELAMIK